MGTDVVPMDARWMASADLRPQVAGPDPYGHGEEDPKRQESVEKGQPFHAAILSPDA